MLEAPSQMAQNMTIPTEANFKHLVDAFFRTNVLDFLIKWLQGHPCVEWCYNTCVNDCSIFIVCPLVRCTAGRDKSMQGMLFTSVVLVLVCGGFPSDASVLFRNACSFGCVLSGSHWAFWLEFLHLSAVVVLPTTIYP